jgi:hypothetical protein
MAERCYTDEELDRDALSIAVMDDGTKISILPNDHPYFLARNARYKAEAQAERDAARIDAKHHFAGDRGEENLMPYLDGKPVPDAVECYVGEHGWVKCLLLDEKGHARITANNNVESVTVTGHVELRPKT